MDFISGICQIFGSQGHSFSNRLDMENSHWWAVASCKPDLNDSHVDDYLCCIFHLKYLLCPWILTILKKGWITNYCSFAATVPELLCGGVIVREPTSILNFLRKQVRRHERASLFYDVFNNYSCCTCCINDTYWCAFRGLMQTMSCQPEKGQTRWRTSLWLMRSYNQRWYFFSSIAWRCLTLLFRAVSVRPTVAHFLGGCRKLHQRDTALVCGTLAFPA